MPTTKRKAKPKFSWVKAGLFIPGDRFLYTTGRGAGRSTEVVRVVRTDPYRVVGLLAVYVVRPDGHEFMLLTYESAKYRVPKGGKNREGGEK